MDLRSFMMTLNESNTFYKWKYLLRRIFHWFKKKRKKLPPKCNTNDLICELIFHSGHPLYAIKSIYFSNEIVQELWTHPKQFNINFRLVKGTFWIRERQKFVDHLKWRQCLPKSHSRLLDNIRRFFSLSFSRCACVADSIFGTISSWDDVSSA